MPDAPLLIVSSLTDAVGIAVFGVADGDGRLELVRETPGISNPYELGNTVTAFHYDAERGLLLEQGNRSTRSIGIWRSWPTAIRSSSTAGLGIAGVS